MRPCGRQGLPLPSSPSWLFSSLAFCDCDRPLGSRRVRFSALDYSGHAKLPHCRRTFLHQLWIDGLVPKMLTFASANVDIYWSVNAPDRLVVDTGAHWD